MPGYETYSRTTADNFDEKGYIELNPEIVDFCKNIERTPFEHYSYYGKYKGLNQFNRELITKARENKKAVLERILDFSLPHTICEDGSYDFLTDELKEQFKIFDTKNVSSNNYLYEGFEENDSVVILDCGAGFRPLYFENVIYMDIVNYLSTDVAGVGEKLPFLDNSFDYVFSYAVLEHVTNPQKCAEEIIRVLKPGGKVYFDAVFMTPYHGYPSHYFNFTPSGARLLFEKGCDVISQTVPEHFHPIFTLTWFLEHWASGLSGDSLEEFLNTPVREFVNTKPFDFILEKKSYIKDLSQQMQEVIAAGTRVVIQKNNVSN